MFQSHVFLEVRILISKEKQTFISGNKPELISSAVKKAVVFAQSLNVQFLKESIFEKLVSKPSVPENCLFSGLSVKLGEKGFMEIEFHHRKKKINQMLFGHCKGFHE